MHLNPASPSTSAKSPFLLRLPSATKPRIFSAICKAGLYYSRRIAERPVTPFLIRSASYLL